jgi:hydroxyacylglutathione hydrolase
VKELAPDVWQINLPLQTVNCYVIGDVLVDALTRHDGKRILKQLDGHTISAHALTHAHPDHQGASHRVCEELAVPYWVGEADAAAAENPDLIKDPMKKHPVARTFAAAFTGPGHPVARRLHEGDDVAGFRVLDVPGHSPGHVAFWRESDRVLILGDVLTNMDQLTGLRGLHEPKAYLTTDPAQNRDSARKVAKLEPALVCFGHGPAVRDTRKFVEFVEGLAS